MSKIDNIDLGVVTTLEQIQKQTMNEAKPSMAVLAYNPNMMIQTQEWRVEGFLIDPTQAAVESLENIKNHGLICFIDLADIDSLVLGYGKVPYFRFWREEGGAGLISYEAIIKMQSAIGLTHIQTTDGYLHDLLYRAKFKRFDPQLGRFNKTWSSNRLQFNYEFYVDNYKAATQNLLLELQCGDDIFTMQVKGWKSGAWNSIGIWGEFATAWGSAASAWTDDDAVSHTLTADRGNRGASLGIGTISLGLGCKKRILLKLTNFLTGAGTHLSTKYGSHQLLLQVLILHSSRESLRPTPHITYIEGGTEDGVA